jgi:archaellum component FlaC
LRNDIAKSIFDISALSSKAEIFDKNIEALRDTFRTYATKMGDFRADIDTNLASIGEILNKLSALEKGYNVLDPLVQEHQKDIANFTSLVLNQQEALQALSTKVCQSSESLRNFTTEASSLSTSSSTPVNSSHLLDLKTQFVNICCGLDEIKESVKEVTCPTATNINLASAQPVEYVPMDTFIKFQKEVLERFTDSERVTSLIYDKAMLSIKILNGTTNNFKYTNPYNGKILTYKEFIDLVFKIYDKISGE